MEQSTDFGILLKESDIKLHRKYFMEMLKLLGIQVLYRAPLKDKHWTLFSEIESNYAPPIKIGCIFTEHPSQQTLKKMGWVSELQPNSSIIHIPYDTPDIQQGALFIIPSGLDNAKGRLFRVVKLSNSIIYPASIDCEIVPEYENTYEPSLDNFDHSSFNVLRYPEEENTL